MGIPIWMAMEPGERPVVKGKVKSARLQLWQDGVHLIGSGEIEPKNAPWHLNNITSWYRLAANKLRSMELIKAYARCSSDSDIQVLVNDGEGAKEGRGSNENKFSLLFKCGGDNPVDLRLDIFIETESHQSIYQKQIKNGERQVGVRTKKASERSGLPYIFRPTMEIVLPLPEGGDFRWGEREHEEFYREHPTFRGALKVYD